MQDDHANSSQSDANPPTSASPSTSSLIDPVPLSLPSILINPRPRAKNPTTVRASSSTSQQPRYLSGSSSSRHIGKRKLIRQSNNRFTSNPHAVRPRRSDFYPSYAHSERSSRNLYQGSTSGSGSALIRSIPVDEAPRDERQVREWRRELDAWNAANAGASGKKRAVSTDATAAAAVNGLSLGPSNSSAGYNDDTPGMFTMSLPEARTFLKRRAGVWSRRDPHAPPHDSDLDTTSPLQSLVDTIEDEFEIWKTQVVFRDGPSSAKAPKVVFTDEDGENEHGSASTPRVVEHTHLPHTLVYEINDSFDRLVIHSLARVWGLRSFSKDGGGAGGKRYTHILKPPEKKRLSSQVTHDRPRAGMVNPLIRHLASGGSRTSDATPPPPSSRSNRPSRMGAGGLDTPPTTDVGSELDSASEFEGWTEESEAGDDDDGDDGDEEQSEVGEGQRRQMVVVPLDEPSVHSLGDVEEEGDVESEGASARGDSEGGYDGSDYDETLR